MVFFSSLITFFSSPISVTGANNEDLFVVFPICTAAGGNDPRAELFTAAQDSLMKRNPNDIDPLATLESIDGTGFEQGGSGGVLSLGSITLARRQQDSLLKRNPRGDDAVTNPSVSYSQDLQDADPNLLKCFKCAIVDRSRLMLPNPVDSSDFCQMCFGQYCYDPKNEPSASEIGGRKFVFADSNLSNEISLKKQGVQLCIGFAAGVAALTAIAVVIFLWRRRRQGGRRHEKYSYSPIKDEDNV